MKTSPSPNAPEPVHAPEEPKLKREPDLFQHRHENTVPAITPPLPPLAPPATTAAKVASPAVPVPVVPLMQARAKNEVLAPDGRPTTDKRNGVRHIVGTDIVVGGPTQQ